MGWAPRALGPGRLPVSGRKSEPQAPRLFQLLPLLSQVCAQQRLREGPEGREHWGWVKTGPRSVCAFLLLGGWLTEYGLLLLLLLLFFLLL